MQVRKDSSFKKESINLLVITLGIVIFVLGLRGIIVPSFLATGGVSGLAVIFYYLFNTPIGLIILALNIPLFVLGWCFIDKAFIFRTLYGVILSSFLIDLTPIISLVPPGEMLLGAIYGGILNGLGMGIIFRYGGSLGGTDIISKIINRRFGYSIGSLTLILNGIIILSSAFFVGQKTALYTLIAIFVSGKVIDFVQGGIPMKTVTIISRFSSEITQEILSQIGHGVTVLKGEGGYTHQGFDVLLCVVHLQDLYNLKRIVKEIDPAAFIIISNCKEVVGKGFHTFEV